jgi:hypothetical protein
MNPQSTHFSPMPPSPPPPSIAQCLVEVTEDDNGTGYDANHEEEPQADWNQITYHLNKPKLSHSSLEALLTHDHLTCGDPETVIPQYYPRTDAQKALRHQRLVWNQQKQKQQLSNSSDDDEESEGDNDHEEEEEKGEFLSQREKIRQQHQQKQQQQFPQQSPSADLATEIIPSHLHHSHHSSSSSDTSSNVSMEDEVHHTRQAPQPQPQPVSLPLPSNRSKTAILLRYKEIVSISDYDFSRRNIIIRVGAPIEFILDPSTPSHVEHVLEGRSVHSELCFMSEILQLPYSGKFVFIPNIAGEIFVTCQIYSDMTCRVVVINPPPPAPLPPASFTSASHGMYDSKRKLQQHTQTYSPRLPFSSSSNKFSQSLTGSFPITHSTKPLPFLDEDPLPDSCSQSLPPFSPNPIQSLSSTDNTSLPLSSSFLGISEKLYFHSSGPLSISSSFGDANSVASSVLDSDDGPDDDLLYFQTSATTSMALELHAPESAEHPPHVELDRLSPSINNFPLTPRYAPISSRLSADLSPDAVVYVEDFKFQPSRLELQVGQTVLFQSTGHASMQKLSCFGEFEGVPLDSSESESPSSHFLYTFLNLGIFLVKNEIFSFMECEIVVIARSEQQGQGEGEMVGDMVEDGDVEDAESSAIFDDEIQKFYQHLNYQSHHPSSPSTSVSVTSPAAATVPAAPPRDGSLGRPIPLLGSFSAISPKGPSTQHHLMASVDWGLGAEEFSDDDHESEEEEGPMARRTVESEKNLITISPIEVSQPHIPSPTPSRPSPPALSPSLPSPDPTPAPSTSSEKAIPEIICTKKVKKNKKKKKRRKKQSAQSGLPDLDGQQQEEQQEEQEGDQEREEEQEDEIEQVVDEETAVAVDVIAEEENLSSLSSQQQRQQHNLLRLHTPISFLDPPPGAGSQDRTSLVNPQTPPPSAHTSPSPTEAPVLSSPPSSPPKKENNLMTWLHSASAKKRSQQETSQKIPPNPIDQLLFESLCLLLSTSLPLTSLLLYHRMARYQSQISSW